jgi:hypothetical protein
MGIPRAPRWWNATVVKLLNWTVVGRLGHELATINCPHTVLVGLVTVTGVWVFVLVAVPISSAFSLMAERRRQEAAAKPERDAGQRVDAIRERARRAFPLKYPPMTPWRT